MCCSTAFLLTENFLHLKGPRENARHNLAFILTKVEVVVVMLLSHHGGTSMSAELLRPFLTASFLVVVSNCLLKKERKYKKETQI